MTPKKFDRLHPLDGGKVTAPYTRHPVAVDPKRSFLPHAPRTVRRAKA